MNDTLSRPVSFPCDQIFHFPYFQNKTRKCNYSNPLVAILFIGYSRQQTHLMVFSLYLPCVLEMNFFSNKSFFYTYKPYFDFAYLKKIQPQQRKKQQHHVEQNNTETGKNYYFNAIWKTSYDVATKVENYKTHILLKRTHLHTICMPYSTPDTKRLNAFWPKYIGKPFMHHTSNSQSNRGQCQSNRNKTGKKLPSKRMRVVHSGCPQMAGFVELLNGNCEKTTAVAKFSFNFKVNSDVIFPTEDKMFITLKEVHLKLRRKKTMEQSKRVCSVIIFPPRSFTNGYTSRRNVKERMLQCYKSSGGTRKVIIMSVWIK